MFTAQDLGGKLSEYRSLDEGVAEFNQIRSAARILAQEHCGVFKTRTKEEVSSYTQQLKKMGLSEKVIEQTENKTIKTPEATLKKIAVMCGDGHLEEETVSYVVESIFCEHAIKEQESGKQVIEETSSSESKHLDIEAVQIDTPSSSIQASTTSNKKSNKPGLRQNRKVKPDHVGLTTNVVKDEVLQIESDVWNEIGMDEKESKPCSSKQSQRQKLTLLDFLDEDLAAQVTEKNEQPSCPDSHSNVRRSEPPKPSISFDFRKEEKRQHFQLSMLTQLWKKQLIQNRHESNEDQHAYDKQFGLVKI